MDRRNGSAGARRAPGWARLVGASAGVLVAAMVAAQVPVLVAGAAPGLVTTVTGSPSVRTAGDNATYTVTFKATTGLVTGSTVTVKSISITTTPKGGSTLPATKADYAVTDTTTGGGTLSVTAVTKTVTTYRAKVALKLTSGTVAAGNVIKIVITNVVNSQVAGTKDHMQVQTSVNPGFVNSTPPYSIKGATATLSTIAATRTPAPTGAVGTKVTLTALATGKGTTGTAPRPVPNDVITVTATGTAKVTGASSFRLLTTGKGKATVTVTDSKAETATFTATDINNPTKLKTVAVTFDTPMVTTVTATPSSATAGTTATYKVGFKTSPVGLVRGPTGTITLAGPAGTVMPSTVADYTFPTANHPTAVTRTNAYATATLTLPTRFGPGPSTPFTVTVAGVTNPTKATAGYKLAVSTSSDTIPATSAAYAITAGPVDVTSSTVGAQPLSTTSTSVVTVTLKDRYGNPVSGKTVALAGKPATTVTITPATAGSDVTNATGKAVFTATDSAAQAVKFTATDTTDTLTVTQTATVTFVAGTPVTNVKATLSTPEAGATDNYTVTFTTSATGALGTTAQIIVRAHPGTVLPACTNLIACTGVYTVTTGAATGVVVTRAVALSTTGSTTPNQAVITVHNSGIGNSAAVKVVITGATNLTLSNPGYVLVVSTSVDSAAVNSNTFTITPGPANAKKSQVQVFATRTSVPADGLSKAGIVVTVRDRYGNLVTTQGVTLAGNTGSHAVIAPTSSKTGPPLSGAPGVAGFVVTDATVEKVTFTATTTTPKPSHVITQTATVTFTTPTQVSGIAVSVQNPYTAQFAQYTVGFVTSATGALGNGSSIALTAPPGTFFPSTAGNYKVSASTGGTATVGSVVTLGTNGSTTPNTVALSLSSASIAAKATVTVVAGFVANPPQGSSSYTMAVGTSADTAYPQAVSAPYTINGPGLVNGYWMVAADGGIFNYGKAQFYGSMGGKPLNKPIVGMALTPSRQGYWEVASDGGIFAFGNATFYGSMGGKPLNKPIVGIAATPDGKGYWEVASDGGIFAFGDATFFGSMGGKPLNKPIVGIATLPNGQGYWEVASDGGIFSFGQAKFYGSTGSIALNKPIVGMTPTADGGGYWLVATDGGIFNYGDAKFFGSAGSLTLNKPIIGMAPSPDGQGYWLAASDGGIFTYGDATFEGSAGALPLVSPVVAVAS